MGSNSSYSALKEDQVSFVGGNEDSNMNSSTESVNNVPPQSIVADKSTEIVIELQVFVSLYFFLAFILLCPLELNVSLTFLPEMQNASFNTLKLDF